MGWCELRDGARFGGVAAVAASIAASVALASSASLAPFAYADPAGGGWSPAVRKAAPEVQPASHRDHRADLNGDGYADLLVGGSVDRRNPDAISWGVSVIYGGPGGLARPGNQLWQESDFNTGAPTRGTVSAFVTGDFDGDGCDDVAVGTDEVQLDYDDEAFVGEVRIIYGSPRGSSQGS